MKVRLLFFVSIAASFSACSGMRTAKLGAAAPGPALAVAARHDVEKIALTDEIAKADSQMEEEPAGAADAPKTSITEHPKVLLEVNARVQKWIDYFTKKDPRTFLRLFQRGRQYRSMVEAVLIEHDIPKEFYYLALIESGYRNHAVSSAKAVGVWQFIAGTARRYNLRCDSRIDERRDVARATKAAAQYLRDLYNVFGSWRLAMAAYNAGENRIMRAIMKGKTRDFWTLAEQRVLPKETMHYVPKFLAAVIVGEDPEKYGLQLPREESPKWDAVLVEVPSPVALASIAEEGKISFSDLKRLNPHLRAGHTPAGVKTYGVWVPEKSAEAVSSSRAVLAAKRIKAPRVVSTSNAKYHRVRKGETLGSIARRYQVSVTALKRANGLRSNRILAGKQLRIRPARSTDTVLYRVRRGDTLLRIAERFGVPVRKIKKWNDLRSANIMRGQTLTIRPGTL